MANLSDTEIIKAFEEHYHQVDAGYSTHLEHGGKGDEHEEKYIYMLRDVLDLINRLKAENERLKQERDKEHDYCNHYARMCAKAKSEARKEFAERLKEKAKMPLGTLYGEMLYIEDVDNLLEEMG